MFPRRRSKYTPRRGETAAGAPKWNSDPLYTEMQRKHNTRLARESLARLGFVSDHDNNEEPKEEE